MNNSGNGVAVLMIVLCAAPLAKLILDIEKATTGDFLVGVSGVVVAIFLISQQIRGARESVKLRMKADAITSNVGQVNRETQILLRELVIRDPNDPAKNDNSEAGIAWKRIQASENMNSYINFRNEYPESNYDQYAIDRQYQIDAWQKVDLSDPFEVYFFLLSNPFTALRLKAEESLTESLEKLSVSRSAALWRNVGLPFLILAPMAYLIFPVGIYFVGELIEFTEIPEINSVIETTVLQIETWLNSVSNVQYEIVKNVLGWLGNKTELLVRIAFVVTISVIFIGTALAVIMGVFGLWVSPHIGRMERAIAVQIRSEFDILR